MGGLAGASSGTDAGSKCTQGPVNVLYARRSRIDKHGVVGATNSPALRALELACSLLRLTSALFYLFDHALAPCLPRNLPLTPRLRGWSRALSHS